MAWGARGVDDERGRDGAGVLNADLAVARWTLAIPGPPGGQDGPVPEGVRDDLRDGAVAAGHERDAPMTTTPPLGGSDPGPGRTSKTL
ncbi:MAG: hypothetical protein EXR76_16185 [Myxococcales bacterium]|nr:hypothetical protein [Myxococcales bacterium]